MNSGFPFITLIVLLFAQSVLAKGKEEPSKPLVTDTIIGYTLSKQPIMARQYAFDEIVSKFDVGSNNNQVTLVLRERKKMSWGKLGQFDVASKQFTWLMKRDLFNTKISFAGNRIFYHTPESGFAYDKNTGEKIYRFDKRPIFWYKSNYTIALFPSENGKIYSLSAFDLNTGNVAWTRKTYSMLNTTKPVYLNDSTLMLSDYKYLHLINLCNGGGWFYDINTEASDYNKTFLDNIPGICSNIAVEDSCIYFSDARHLSALNTKGKCLWEWQLDIHFVSASEIILHGDKVILFNKGYAMAEDGIRKFGKPFLVAFSKQKGEQLYLDTLGTANGQTDYEIRNNVITISTGNRLYQIDLLTGQQLNSVPFLNERDIKETFTFTDDNKFFLQDKEGQYVSLAEQFPGSYCLLSSKNKLKVFDASLKEPKELDISQVWEYYRDYKSYKWIHNNKDKFVFLDGRQKVAETAIPDSCFVRDNKIYGINNGRLQVTALPEVMN